MFIPTWLRQTTLSTVLAAFITVLVGYTSSVAIIFQAAQAVGANQEIISSWMWALGVGMGVTSFGLSWWYKVPMLTAWSLPGAALLITALSGYTINEAIGAFIMSSLMIVACGVTGFFERFMDKIPLSLGAAMLAGILVNFGTTVFTNIEYNPLLPAAMLVMYVVSKRFFPRFAILSTLAIGVFIGIANNTITLSDIEFSVTSPVYIHPEFSLKAMISISLPLFIVTMTGQNFPGVTVLKTYGYSPHTSASLNVTGGVGLLLAPFGCYAINLAAVTAAICMTDDVHPNKERRYIAGMWVGIFYILIGTFGATVASLLLVFPHIFIATLAGIALFPTIANSFTQAMSDDKTRESALITFLTTASGLTLFGIGSAFWGIIFGTLALIILTVTTKKNTE